MKIAVVSSDASGAWFLLRLMQEGNDCDYFLLEKDNTRYSLKGLIPKPQFEEPKSWRGYDLVIFDGNSDGKLADRIRKQAPVIGCSDLSCKLEDDRLFGIEAMEQMGIDVPPYESFDSPEEARKFLEKNPDRYVYKPFQEPNGEEVDCSITYVASSASDMARSLDRLFEKSYGAPFLLQKVVEGVEISTEAWFDGSQFHFINATLEEKKFLAGNLGRNVGCSGNIVWPYRVPPLVYTRGLGRAQEWLRARNYRGMIDLNSIVTRNTVYGLEWTSRFGYHASATLLNLLSTPWAEFFHSFADAPAGGHAMDFKTDAEFGAAIDISTPPFPESTGDAEQGKPIEGIDPEYAGRECYLYDAMMDGDDMVTAGINGDVGAILGKGHTSRGAWGAAMDYVKKIKVPDLQWRIDLEKTTGERYRKLQEAGWL